MSTTSRKEIKIFCSDPDLIADGLLQSDYVFDPGGKDLKGGAWTLRWWRDDFYRWVEGCWIRVSDAEMKLIVTEHIQKLNLNASAQREPEQKIAISTQKINNILLCLSSKVRTPETRKLNTWLDGREKLYHTMAFNNGLLMIRNNGSDPVELVPHTPKYFTLTKLPYDYNPDAKCPKWLKFLDEVMLGREDYILLLQQWLAYLIRPDLREQKFLLSSGPGANGKGVVSETYQTVVGKENCSQVGLTRFSNPFALYSTLDKILNCTNESSHIIEDEAENILKSFVAGDMFTFERKFKDPVSAQPTAKVMISTNALPRFNDKTQGIWRRILLVPFDKVIPDNEQDKKLADKLKAELAGIFNWGLSGLQKLNESGFVEPEDNKALLENYRRDADPTRAFLMENYAAPATNGQYTGCAEIYSNYKQWCEDNGCRPLGERMFGKQVRRIFDKVERRKIGGRDGREYVYQGLVSYEDALYMGHEDQNETEEISDNEPENNDIPF